MIFKTMTNTSGKTGIRPNNFISGLFNGDLFKKQTFSLSEVLSTSDVDAIKAYNKQIDNCVTSQTAFNRTMLNTSKEAQNVVAAANGNKVALDGLTKSSKAAELGMKALAMAGNMLLIYALTSAVDIIYKCATASDRLAESASQMGSEFASTKSDISDYKTKIEELYQTINDDTSSYEDTYNARQELLKIQDEMIDKFGDEADAVKFVTDAINGQTDSLDTLTQDKWQETVNAFNSDRGKGWTEKVADVFANIGHDNNNFQRMIDEMENTKVTFHMIPMYGDDTYEEFSKKLKEDFGADITRTERDDAITLSGDLDTIYKQLLNIQTLAKGMGIDDTFLNDLGNQADEAKSKLDEYQEMYSQHVLYDKVFNSEEYEKSFDAINKAYEKYQDAFASGDEESIEKAKQNYAEIVQSATEGLDDQSVINYFNSMYPDLQEVVGGWEFEVKFKAAVDDNSDDFEKDVQDAVSKFGTVEDIKNYNPKVATDEQKDAYLQLKQYADDYGLTLDQLIDKLVQLGLLQSQSKSDLLNKLIPSKSAPTAGVTSILTDAMDSVDADEATKWVESLTEEEAKLANSKDFENALEEQKKKLNGASLSADDYAAALQAVKDKQNENSDETPISKSVSDTVSTINDLKSNLSDLDTLMADCISGDGIDVSNLDNICTKMKELQEAGKDIDMTSVENAIQQISDASSLSEAQSALDSLCTQYVYASGVLDDLTDSNKELVKARLEGIGVANADEVVEQQLEAQKLATKIATEGLTEATINEIQELMDEQGYSEQAQQGLYQLLLTKIDLSNNPINTASDIEQLIALANAAGTAGQYVTALQNILANLGAKTPAKYTNDYNDTNSMRQESMQKQQMANYDSVEDWGYASATKVFNAIQSSIKKNQLSASSFIKTPKYSGGSSSSSARDKANKSSGGSGSGNNSSSEPQEQDYDWIETLISRVQRKVTNLGKTVSATYKSWSTRNNALAQELSAVNEQISAEQGAYNKYMQLANSVGLSENYASLVRNGALDVSTIADDDLNDKIKKYQDFYNKALEAADAVADLQDQLAELAKTKFDSVTSQFEAQLKVIEQEKGMYETFLDETETAGYLASTKYYNYLISTEKKNIEALKNEFNSLSNAMGEAIANGKIEQGSEQWNEMQSSILDVQTAIEDANKSLLEYQKNLRELKWDTFDKTEEYIGKIQDESNFLIDLMSNQTLYDDKTGKDTKYATAIKGLHAVNYNAYMAQSDDYAKEIQEIDKEMANDPYNKDLLERRQELLASQQEAIKNAEQEKQSIKSLVKDGYDAQLDALQKLIDKYKDSINSVKDLYDYQKNIKEQTDSLAALQKQKTALSGDNSEETQSKLQQLDKQIADAKSDLQDTEYQQYLSDQEKLLDDLYDQTEEWINARLDDLDGLIQQEIDNTNANSAQINQTITDETQKVGYTITDQMKSIWNSSDGFTAVVSNYCNGFQNTATSILDAVNYIKGYVEQLKKKADAEAAEKARQAELARQQAAQKAAAAAAAQKQQQASSSSSSGGSSGGGNSSGNFFIYRKDSYPKNKLKVDSSIVDRLKYRDYASDFNTRKMYYEKMGLGSASSYRGTASQNRNMINWMRNHGYKSGTKSATKGIHLVGEEANEIGIAQGRLVDFSGGETVFNGDMTKKLWAFADNPSAFMSDLVKPPTLPKLTSSSTNSNVDVGGVNIVMNGVNDVQTFSKQMREALADNAQTQKMFRSFINKDSIEFKKYK